MSVNSRNLRKENASEVNFRGVERLDNAMEQDYFLPLRLGAPLAAFCFGAACLGALLLAGACFALLLIRFSLKYNELSENNTMLSADVNNVFLI